MRPGDRVALAAFILIVLIGGLNFVAVRFSNAELAPMWGAALRFGSGAILLFAYAAARRIALPTGAALVGAVVYGVLGFGAGYALAYVALVHLSAGLGAVIMALVPLLTFIFAFGHGLERFAWRAVAGALIAAGGIAIMFADRLGAGMPLGAALAMIGAAASAAETGVVVKWFPRPHPVAANAIGMGVGTIVLIAGSLVTGERWAIPTLLGTWTAVAYLTAVGSVGMFMLYLFVLKRWTASATSYMFVLTPIIAFAAGAMLAGEGVSPAVLIGSAVVLAAVYLGALAPAGSSAAKRSVVEAPAK